MFAWSLYPTDTHPEFKKKEIVNNKTKFHCDEYSYNDLQTITLQCRLQHIFKG